MKVNMLCESSTFSVTHWTHGAPNPKFDYLKKVLEYLVTGKPIKLGKNGTDGTISIDNFVKDPDAKLEFEKVLQNIAKYNEAFKNPSIDLTPFLNKIPSTPEWLDTFLDVNSDLPPIIANKLNNNRIKGPIVWLSIYKQTFSGHDKDLPKEEQKINKGDEFEDTYRNNLNAPGPNETKLQLQNLINKEGAIKCYYPDMNDTIPMGSYYMGAAVDAGKTNAKRPLTFINNNLYFVPSIMNSSDIFDVGKTVTDATIPLYTKNSYDQGMLKPDASLYISLKFSSQVTFVNGGLKDILPMYIYNHYRNENNENNLQSILSRKPIDEIAYDDPLNDLIDFQNDKGNYLLKLLCINKIRFIDTFINFDERMKHSDEYKKRKTGPYILEEVEFDDEHAEQLRQFVMSTVGYGFIFVHEVKKGVVDCIDVRKKEQMGKLFLGHNSTDSIPVPLVNKVVAMYPAFHQAKRVRVQIEYPNITLIYEFRSKKADAVYPKDLMCNYNIKSIPE